MVNTITNTAFNKTTAIILSSLLIGTAAGVGGIKVYQNLKDKETQVTQTTTSNQVTGSTQRQRGPRAQYRNNQNHNHRGDTNHTDINSMPKQELSTQEIEDILYMREEEKLARDVYLFLYERWGAQIFENIAKSEQRHMDAVKTLIDKYSLNDPIKTDTRGVFTNKDLQALYNKLISEGSKNLIDALKVGATIEDVDIYDLNKAIERTDNKDVKTVYENLKRGSYNHMRAFVKQLNKEGSDYTPQYISVKEFKDILK